MHKGHRTLIKVLLLELHTVDLLIILPHTHGIVGRVNSGDPDHTALSGVV